jgi:hypothetical protein
MNGLKIAINVMVMVLIFGQPSMMLSMQRRASETRICLGVLLQVVVMLLLPLLKFNIHMPELENIPKMQELLIFLKKMRMVSKMNTLTSQYKLNQHKQMRIDLNQVEGKLLVMLINFIWMICCFRLVCNFVFTLLKSEHWID